MWRVCLQKLKFFSLKMVLWNALSHSPQADLNIPGLQRTNLDLTSVEKTSLAILLLAYLSGTQETKAL